MGRPQARTWLLIAAFVLFTGLILYSLGAVRHSVDGTPATEPEITRDSLTHAVERGSDGELSRPGDGESGDAQGDSAQPCPT